MQNFTPYRKLSKKRQKEIAAQSRGNWGGLNPITRKPADPKAYHRQKARRWKDDDSISGFFSVLFAETKIIA